MKAIVLTACNRPDYLREMLESLSKNDLTGYKLLLGIEPKDQSVIDLCNNIDFIETDIVVNESILGVRVNPHTLLKRAFTSGYTQVVYLEDDLLISPDAIEMCNWYFKRPEKNKHLCFNLYNHDSDENNVNEIHTSGKFSALGFAITQYQWKKFFDPSWFMHKSGWDFSFTGIIESGRATNMLPALSRTHHIGRFGGVHYRANMHDEMYIHNKYNEDKKDIEYTLVTNK